MVDLVLHLVPRVLTDMFKLAAATQFGSGWAWLALHLNLFLGSLNKCLGIYFIRRTRES
ncbi:hypothetical protein KIW84_044073 [Lathyrus oleraceus]|uniref:Uncharacterized protein n=1 Tax=Pisum sativum TaxID=3888 RepID=A0A9D4XJB5_PEA|nr:hypothetical protein KIW84_044073 [Pisum sativum]